MLARLTIRQRVLITFVVIVLAGAVVQLLIAGRQLQLATLEFYQHHLETDALLVAATFSESIGYDGDEEGSRGMQRSLTILQQQVGHDYLILNRTFDVIGYTGNPDLAQVKRVSATPELIQADTNRIGSDIRLASDGQDRLYVAVSIEYEAQTVGYIVLSDLMQPAYAQVNQHWLELAGASLPVIGLVIAASLWISGTISRPIQQLRNSALQMAGGALDTRMDVTSQDEVGQLGQTFNYMAGQIESLLKAQRSFVSNAAHELRTPLMTLKLRAEALENETLPPVERDAYRAEILQEIDHMAGLVSSLLVLARIDEGRQVHVRDEIVMDTASMLHDIARHWRIASEKASLHFEAEIASELPGLPVNPGDLRLILDNLLGNAVKYTPHGTVHLRAACNDHQFMLVVEDSGIGFTPEQSSHLFDRFYRSEQVRGQLPGNGLGLAIVKSLLEQYGGQVEAQSHGSGQGARFTVILPLRQPTKRVILPEP